MVMSEIAMGGLDLVKDVIQVHRAHATGRAVLRKKLAFQIWTSSADLRLWPRLFKMPFLKAR